jgi:16S rRNA (adenine1518-N6/adenine1519-N6)-dimethyltransferase
VVTIEIDRYLAPIAREEFEPLGNVTLLEQDALQSKNVMHPLVVETLREKVSQIKGGRIKLVANLPYNVATPILSNLLDMDPWPVRMVATIQRELAERIAAEPRSRDYSALSIWIQSQARVEIVRNMPASVFWPKPKVESSILDIRPQTVLRDRLTDRAKFHELIRGIFTHRRKFLRSALVSAVKEKLSKPDVDEVLKELELGPDARAEQLTVEQMIELYDCVQKRIEELPPSGE